ncbi:MAG: hypothetical protein Q9221_002800 [Calogaya cf. arnoldii]
MASSPLHYNRIQQIVKFYLFSELTSSQRSSLISNLLHYEQVTGLRLVDNGDAFLTVLEDDIRLLHTSSNTISLPWSKKRRLRQTKHERSIRSLLDAQSPSALRILQEDIASLHAPFATIPGFKNQSNGEPKCIARHYQPNQLQEVLPEPLQPLVLSVHPMDVSVESKFPVVKLPASKDKFSTGSQAPATSANNLPVTGYRTLLANAPPLSASTDPEPNPKKKRRRMAADFFDPDGASKAEAVSTKPGVGSYSSEDITNLIEVEKAKALKKGSLMMAERNGCLDNVAAAKSNTSGRSGYLRYTMKPPETDYSCDPSTEYAHRRKNPSIIDLTVSEESTGEQAGLDNEHSRSPLDVSSRPQGNNNNMTSSSLAPQDVTVFVQGTPRSPHAKDTPAVKERKRKRDLVETNKRKRISTTSMQLQPGASLVMAVNP